jgi:hypothetical protein
VSAQPGHVPPPQLRSVSAPFLTLSLQLAAWHSPPVQTPLWQSAATMQAFDVAHLPGQEPPQSTSVSDPFLAVSLQLLLVQTLLAHKVLAQSEPAVHALPPGQRAQPDSPPQSVSDSAPFLIRSLQAGALQVREPAGHTPLTQSPASVQLLPSVHLGQVPPPQLRSVSAPFCAESLQVGAWHTLPVHTPLAQSEAAEQALELAH